MRLNLNYVMATFGAARGVDFTKAIRPEEEVIADMQKQQEAQVAQQQAIDSNKAAAQKGV